MFKMSKSVECCADCSAVGPSWASVNRGIYLCDDCGSIHRTLGRHVSIVKSLKRGVWPSSLLCLVKELHFNGSNEIWEHKLLLDSPSSIAPPQLGAGNVSRKPSSNDSASKKQEFIQSKHRYLSFVQRVARSTHAVQEALNEDLFNVVRTGAVKDALRYIVLGADPNWLHPQKKTRPLHIASRSGQASQVELLLLWGADPLSEDEHGQQATEYAFGAGHDNIALRLQEAAFEVPDRLTSYVTSGRRPDHAHGIHFLEPELSDVPTSDDQRQTRKLSRATLRALGGEQLKNLSDDIYDEVDRRELDEQFSAAAHTGTGLHHHHVQHASATISPHGSTPFLPVDPRFSSVRNQARQKLALLNVREFIWLIVDLLGEIRHRYGHQQVVQSVKVSATRNSGSSSQNAAGVVPSNEVFHVERSPAGKLHSSSANSDARHNDLSVISQYGSAGRAGIKHGARLRELPSTASSEAYTGDGYEEPSRLSVSDKATNVDSQIFSHADADDDDDADVPDYDEVDQDGSLRLENGHADNIDDYVELSLPSDDAGNSANKCDSSTKALLNGHKHPTPDGSSNRSRGTAHPSSAGGRSSVQQSNGLACAVGNECLAHNQLLDAVNGLRRDFKQLEVKVNIMWEERGHSASTALDSHADYASFAANYVAILPTQAVLTSQTVDITHHIQALKKASDSVDSVNADVIQQHCAVTSDAVMLLVDSFEAALAVEHLLPDDVKLHLLQLSSCSAKLLRESRLLAESIAGKSVTVEADSEKQRFGQQISVLMDIAYFLARNLKALHTAYANVLEAVAIFSPENAIDRNISDRPPDIMESNYATIKSSTQPEKSL